MQNKTIVTLDNYKDILGDNINYYDWRHISTYQTLSEEFIDRYIDKVNNCFKQAEEYMKGLDR